MTYAVVPALRFNQELAAIYEPLLTSRVYDPELDSACNQGRHHRGYVDDREAGRLRRARRHHARPPPTATAATGCTGHKWFTSAPMCDVFLVLAQAPGGL